MKCPICGNENNCFVNSGKDPMKCWCHNEEFPISMPSYGVCVCLDCVRDLKREELRDEIRTAEKRFMEDAIKNGAEGWARHFKEDGMMVSTGVNDNIIGRDNILKAMSNAFVEGFELTWEPMYIEFSDDYSLAYSTGQYKRVLNEEVSRGKFLTIWERTKKGWKIRVDIGN